MSNILDLRKKTFDKVKVVERVIFKPRSFKSEMIRLFSVIMIVLAIGFGISNADDLNPFSEKGIETAVENFSVLGVVSEISNETITVNNAKASDKTGNSTYVLDIAYLEKIETKTYEPLIISDLKVGDTIIAQGLTNRETFFIKRIVSFGGGIELQNTENASTTESINTDIATTTTELSNTTDSQSVGTTTNQVLEDTNDLSNSTNTPTDTTSTSTPGIIETVAGVVEDIVQTVTDVVDSVVDTVTNNSETNNQQSENTEQSQSEPNSLSEPENQSEPTQQSSPDPVI